MENIHRYNKVLNGLEEDDDPYQVETGPRINEDSEKEVFEQRPKFLRSPSGSKLTSTPKVSTSVQPLPVDIAPSPLMTGQPPETPQKLLQFITCYK